MSTPTMNLPGFARPVFESQRVFRAAAMAMARPGMPQRLCDDRAQPLDVPRIAGVYAASLAWLLALADHDTPVWLDERLRHGMLPQYLRFQTGARTTCERQAAHFALFCEDYSGAYLADFPPGLDEYPEASATVLLQVSHLSEGPACVLQGPGVPETITLRATGMAPRFWEEWQANHACYPCGIDVVFIAGHTMVGLPRSIRTTPD